MDNDGSRRGGLEHGRQGGGHVEREGELGLEGRDGEALVGVLPQGMIDGKAAGVGSGVGAREEKEEKLGMEGRDAKALVRVQQQGQVMRVQQQGQGMRVQQQGIIDGKAGIIDGEAVTRVHRQGMLGLGEMMGAIPEAPLRLEGAGAEASSMDTISEAPLRLEGAGAKGPTTVQGEGMAEAERTQPGVSEREEEGERLGSSTEVVGDGGSSSTGVSAAGEGTGSSKGSSSRSSRAGSGVVRTMRRRMSFWRADSLEERQRVVAVGERHLNALSLSAILQRALARKLRSVPPRYTHHLDSIDLPALVKVLLSETGENLSRSDLMARASTAVALSRQKRDMMALQERMGALQTDLTQRFDLLERGIMARLPNQGHEKASREVWTEQVRREVDAAREEARREVWEQARQEVEEARREAQEAREEARKEREEVGEMLRELRREMQLLRVMKGGRGEGGQWEERGEDEGEGGNEGP
ncbi:unnamed protein product [Closterium sp. Yama58-4]|nr:unnamed protein product [Closterium sp. Yama58-4]